MSTMIKTCRVALLLLIAAPLLAQNSAIRWWSLNSGGGGGGAGNNALLSAIGQNGAGVSSAGNTMITGGFLATGASMTMAVSPVEPPIPLAIGLEQNYPNPFNPATVIRYEVPARALVTVSLSNRDARESNVTLKVYDLLGREVATLVNEQKAPGRYEVRFDGAGLTSGVYICRLQAGSFVEAKKMMLLK